jgi:formylglycine-generating enzyme required for sulfatase activity
MLGIQLNRRLGGWNNDAEGCRSAHRKSYTLDYRYDILGFRLALSSVP